METRSALVALGSNVGARERTLRTAVTELSALAGSAVIVSSLYDTPPQGMRPGARSVLNAACLLRTELPALEVLELLQEMEVRFDRVRAAPAAEGSRGDCRLLNEKPTEPAPAENRTLDLDLLLVSGRVLNTPELVLPHPRMHLRAFVLVPACEIAADWIHPTLGQPLSALLKSLPESEVRAVQAGQRLASSRPDRQERSPT